MTKNSDIIPCFKKLITDDIYTVLDLGCGHDDPSFANKELREKEDILFSLFAENYDITGIDAFEGAILFREKFGPVGKYILGDVRNFIELTNGKQYDLIICHHTIEHLIKDDGVKLIKDIESKAKKLIILGAPNGFREQKSNHNPFQGHLSGWVPGDFKDYSNDYSGDVFIVSKKINSVGKK